MKKEGYSYPQVSGLVQSDGLGIESLKDLALNISWSWNHAADELWELLDAELWELTQNPWIVLQTVSADKLERQLANPDFKEKMKKMMLVKERSAANPTWFQRTHPHTNLTCVAYFSMEFMLSEALPIYVGGLGNVAGDQLKSASDLGVPVVAIGLLYQQGYFRQEITKYGEQEALFPYNDPGQLPITPLRLPDGEWLRLQIAISGYPVWLRAWQVQVGKVKLYLLDSNDAVNLPAHRGITSQIYGGESDLRIKQEMILGIGGWKLLRALGIKPEVCHMNEGHAAFLILERACDFMKDEGVSFEAAVAATRAGNLFTTHTAVAAGFDHFSTSLMEQYLGEYAKDELRITFKDLMALGRQDPEDTSESFNMAYLAIHGSGAVNGVSRLHGKVSRHLFECLFPRWPTEEVPVNHVTNGVHMPSWDSVFADKIWTEACGKDRWRGSLEKLEHNISALSDETLWRLRTDCRKALVAYTRTKLENQLSVAGHPAEIVMLAKHAFNENTLTLGFARRFVPYKRPNLLLHDPERFIRILTHPDHPVQMIIAGKAPPFDEAGKALIHQWVQFIEQHHLYEHVVFLSDYDVMLARHLVQGTDVWINTPRRPWEASGTSGMKVLVNGGLNLSELDGWWAEAYTPAFGWALGDEQEHGDDAAWDAKEAEALYALLEQQVVPEFYSRNKNGIPERWVERIRKSMALLTPQFSANRTVREYTEKYYLPAANKYINRTGSIATEIVDVHHDLRNKWKNIKAGEVLSQSVDKGYEFQFEVWLNGITTNHVSVELYADSRNTMPAERIKMNTGVTTGVRGEQVYRARVTTTRPVEDYTIRIVPCYEGVAVPLEDNLVFWTR